MMLGELGRIKLALHAFQRIEQLEPALASDHGIVLVVEAFHEGAL